MTNPMNPVLIQALSALPALTEAQPVQTSVTVTFDQIVRTHNACSDGQNNLKRGFKAHFGRDLRHDEPLTMGMIEISANNYGVNWVFAARSQWREEDARRPLMLALVAALDAAVKITTQSVPGAQAFINVARQYALGTLTRQDAKSAVSALPTRGSDNYVKHAIQGFLNSDTNNHISTFHQLLGLNNDEARHLLGAALLLTCGEEYAAPAVTVFDGARLKIGELIFEVKLDGGRPTLAFVPYRMPEGGQKWKDAQGTEYLILAGAQQAVTLGSGALTDLDAEGQLPGTVRGVSFVLAR